MPGWTWQRNSSDLPPQIETTRPVSCKPRLHTALFPKSCNQLGEAMPSYNGQRRGAIFCLPGTWRVMDLVVPRIIQPYTRGWLAAPNVILAMALITNHTRTGTNSLIQVTNHTRAGSLRPCPTPRHMCIPTMQRPQETAMGHVTLVRVIMSHSD
jgi:hypothetical protein